MIDTNEALEEEQMSNLGCESVSDLIAEVKRLRKLEAAVVGSWMESCNRGSPWHKQLRNPCVDLGYLELCDVERVVELFDGKTVTHNSREYQLKVEHEKMAKQWIWDEYGVEEE